MKPKDLTKREYFAAMALQGLLANSQLIKIAIKHKKKPEEIQFQFTLEARKFADGLIERLEK